MPTKVKQGNHMRLIFVAIDWWHILWVQYNMRCQFALDDRICRLLVLASRTWFMWGLRRYTVGIIWFYKCLNNRLLKLELSNKAHCSFTCLFFSCPLLESGVGFWYLNWECIKCGYYFWQEMARMKGQKIWNTTDIGEYMVFDIFIARPQTINIGCSLFVGLSIQTKTTHRCGVIVCSYLF